MPSDTPNAASDWRDRHARADAALTRFAAEAARPDEHIDLGRAVLVMGLHAYPDLNVTAYLARMDQLALVAGEAVSDAGSRATALASFLFGTTGYRGNAEDYANPRNSFLNEVLDRGVGIPITLSALYLEVARRLDVSAAGIGMPGHFIVKAIEADGRAVLLDPFHRGRVLSEEECRAQVRAMSGGRQPFDPAFLEPVDSRYILTRMLNNLVNAYSDRGETDSLIAVMERLLVLHPHDHDALRKLGLVCAGGGHKRRAMELLGRYLVLQPDAADAEKTRAHINILANDVARWN